MSSKTPRRTSGSKSSGGVSDPVETQRPPAPAEKAGGGGSSGGSAGGVDVCDLLIDVDLEGVRSKGLQGLAVGADLTVRLDRQGGLRSVVCVRTDGEVVGALSAFKNLSALINCLERQVEYSVRVTDIGPGSCHVRGGRTGR